mgnify:CR=1 FL=1
MALPKFGASGRPVFASTGRPAFSCNATQNCPPCTGTLSLSTSFNLRLQGFGLTAGCYPSASTPGFNRIFISGVVVNDLDMLVVPQVQLQCVHHSVIFVPTTGTVRAYALGDNTCPALTPNTQVTNLRIRTSVFQPIRNAFLQTFFRVGVVLHGDVTHFGATAFDLPLAVVAADTFGGTPSSWNCLGTATIPGQAPSSQGFFPGSYRLTRLTI